MKNTFYGLTLTLVLSAGYAQADNYKITGTWANGNGKTVYLCQMTKEKQTLPVDSAVVEDGTFEMTGTFDQIDKRILVVGNTRESILLDGQPIQVNITDQQDALRKKTLGEYDVQINGSREQAVFKQWKQRVEFAFRMVRACRALDESAKDEATKQMEKNFVQTAKNFIDTCKNSLAFACIISDDAQSYEEAKRLYDGLTPEVKASYPGQMLVKRMEFLSQLSEGQTAPEIELPAPDGTLVKLSSLRGKYVLIDFWASWCGPCMAEVPNVKAVYNDYKNKGFEVFGVSLDTDKAAWENAIKQNDLNWIHVCSLKGGRGSEAIAYNVTGIPCTFLLDKDGRIIAKNLRGQALRDKIASLLDNN